VHDPPPCDIGNFEPCNCSGETPGAAMRREFLEETGVLVEGWQKFLSLTYPTARVHFYRAFDDAVYNVETTTDELVALQTLSTRYVPASRAEIVLPINVIPNLAWIIPMALSMETDMATSFDVKAVA
jgi:8-oxo-dGTP pyrophosphatase MutT (NUDIX family)